LTRIDRRTALGKRIAELEALFVGAIPEAELSPLRRLRITEAAQLQSLAEQMRGRLMRDGEVRGASLDDVVRLERRAAQAVRGLGLNDEPPEPKSSSFLVDYFSRPLPESQS